MIKVKRPFGYYDTALGIIGRTGENDTRTIDFDCAAALKEYPDANIICVCLRPGDDEPYTIPLSTDGDHRVLTLSSADLEKEGRLTLELRMVDGDKVLKSARFTGTVTSSLQGEGDTPGTPVRDTLDRLDAEIKAAQAVVNDIRARLDAGEFDGADGYSPTATVSKSGTTTTVSITDKTGTTTATVEDGAKGDKGDPGSDANVTAENIQSALGYAPVRDVQVAGNSVLDGGVANVPVAQTWVNGSKHPGVSAPSIAHGLYISDNLIKIYPAELDNIERRVLDRPITPTNLDKAVKAAMCDGKGAAWTDTEQKAARDRMGVDKPYELIEEIVLNESAVQVVRTNMSLAEMRIVVEVPVSDSAGAVAIEVYSESTLIGYGYIGNLINKENIKMAKFTVKRDHGDYVFSVVSINSNSASQKAGVSALNETVSLFPAENVITKISLYSTSNSILLPVGTKITIKGETT